MWWLWRGVMCNVPRPRVLIEGRTVPRCPLDAAGFHATQDTEPFAVRGVLQGLCGSGVICFLLSDLIQSYLFLKRC